MGALVSRKCILFDLQKNSIFAEQPRKNAHLFVIEQEASQFSLSLGRVIVALRMLFEGVEAVVVVVALILLVAFFLTLR